MLGARRREREQPRGREPAAGEHARAILFRKGGEALVEVRAHLVQPPDEHRHVRLLNLLRGLARQRRTEAIVPLAKPRSERRPRVRLRPGGRVARIDYNRSISRPRHCRRRLWKVVATIVVALVTIVKALSVRSIERPAELSNGAWPPRAGWYKQGPW